MSNVQIADAGIKYDDGNTGSEKYAMSADETGKAIVGVMSSMLKTSVEEDERKRENANINAKLPAGKMHKIASEVSKEYYLDHYLPADQAEAHRNGDIHIHDLDFLTECFNCVTADNRIVVYDGSAGDDAVLTTNMAFFDRYFEDDEEGVRGISEDSVNILVDAEKMGFAHVNIVSRRKASKETILKIQAGRGKDAVSITVSRDHKIPVLISGTNDIVDTEAKDVCAGDTLITFSTGVSKSGIVQYNKQYLIVERITEQEHTGYLYDIEVDGHYFILNGVLVHNCLQMDLGKILHNGWYTEHGYLREPQRIMSATALAAISMQSASVNQFGGISHNAFDYALAPYVGKEFKRQYSNAMSDALTVIVPGWNSSERENLKRFYGSSEEKYGLYPQMKMRDEFIERERKYLSDNYNLTAQQVNNLQSKVYDMAYHKTDSMTHEAMVSFTSNINTMKSRSAGQVVFASVNLGTDISLEGRMVTRQLLLAMEEGLGHGETCIFPIVVFKLKSGVSYNPEDPNYDLFKLACRVSAKRLYPNFVNIDAPYNLKYYKEGHPETEIATMGCRTRVISNVYDPDNEVVAGRGNLFFVTINLPRLGILADHDIDKFYELLDDRLNLCLRHLFTRFNILKDLHADEIPFHMLQGGWTKTENLRPDDTIEEALKQGSMSIGFVGLAETLVALIGKHHGESEEAQKLGLEIVGHIRKFTDDASEKYKLNFSTFATPAESTAGLFARLDKKRFGVIPGVTDRDYYTNSSHVPVYYNISAFDKIRIEAPYHALENAGHIAYVEMDGDPSKNLSAFEAIIRCFHDNNCGYFSINHPVDQDKCCGYVGIIDDVCPKCGRREFEPMSEDKAYEIGLLKRNVSDDEMHKQASILRYCCY